MQLPLGFASPNDPRVCKLKKSLYGLKQASRQWFSKLSTSLIQFGFSQGKSDSSLFIKQTANSFMVLLIYVDDVILASDSLEQIAIVKKYLHDSFTIKDLGELKYFLGIEVARSKKGISLCQRKYALDILQDSGLSASKPVAFPMESNLKLSAHDSSPLLTDPAAYRRLVGRLLYLTITRPDLAYSVQALSQFMASPTTCHLQIAHRVLRYIKATPGQGIFLAANSQLHLKGYSDSDWGGCLDTRRSITRFAIFIGDSLISWKSKKQPTVSRSSAESEYRALASTTCELQWLVYLLADLNVQHSEAALLYMDSKPAAAIASNPVQHERTKHIQLDYPLVREKLQEGLINIIHIPSKYQIVDILTKPLGGGPLKDLCPVMGRDSLQVADVFDERGPKLEVLRNLLPLDVIQMIFEANVKIKNRADAIIWKSS
ncbi:uncharacterized mitochondrial protein AtMg00810-like [Carya illinoinensis]|uniref:uncharacterized mitochondrial protein AtMg00810-like n=1 Tax=Carya illinoinensis TaxID=32201 RepID=UPI001C71B364|nr:uncharacterized mitochondrial protein AtMg00810-like [Carya illinoinensis]